MANEIVAGAPSGVVLYAVLRDRTARPYNGALAVLETYQDAHWTSYALAMAEQGTCGVYLGAMPSGLAAGLYSLDVRQRAGASAAPADMRLAAGTVAWTGSAEAFVLADSSGRPTIAGYASGQDPASLVLATPANKLATTSAGAVQHDMTQLVPTSNTAQTVGDALNAARAAGFGRWTVVGTTLNLYAADGTTIVRSFVLDNALSPRQRT